MNGAQTTMLEALMHKKDTLRTVHYSQLKWV